MVGHVQDQVLAHDGQTDEAEICTGSLMCLPTDIDAGKTRTTISNMIGQWMCSGRDGYQGYG